jgi:hypothetical protein
MVNEQRPTSRARHIATQHFAIQEWRDAGDITLVHLHGVLNPADQQTKPLAARLHYRHVRRLMGHFGPPPLASPVEAPASLTVQPLPGEGVDARSSVSCLIASSSVHRPPPSSDSVSRGSSSGLASPRDLRFSETSGSGCHRACLDVLDTASICPDCRAPTECRSLPHDFRLIGLFPSRSDGSRLDSL